MLPSMLPSTLCAQLGSRVRALRLAQNITQSELAAMAGVSLSSIRRLESSGQGTVALLAGIAVSFGATDAFGLLFQAPVQASIADMERAMAARSRQRARMPTRMPNQARTRASSTGPA
jgi:transcriptional regulator with XRE-family HTH domain